MGRAVVMDEETIGQAWAPIEPLTDAERSSISDAMRSIYETWDLYRNQLKTHSASSLAQFNKRLVRRLSIETGILERIYDLDRGTTEALVAHGFSEDLVARSSTDIEPSRLIDILRDQEAAIELVMDCVAGSRPLTKGLIYELQAILTAHQATTEAVDQFGMRRSIPLKRGAFKEFPNNPRRSDGSIHEYCPPFQVDAEVEQLLSWLSEYDSDDPALVAAWFHHRFTQIHPFQDGNGRTVRAITTLLLLRRGLLPLVIDRDLRTDYLDGLELADRGDLSKLVSTFERPERLAISQALSVDVDAEITHQKSITLSVIDSLATKFNRRRDEKRADLRSVNSLALALRIKARAQLEGYFSSLSKPIEEVAHVSISIINGGPDCENAYWYRSEVVQTANDFGSYVNFAEDHYFVKASMRVDQQRLVLVVSMHHIGRQLSGMMEATCFARLEAFDDVEGEENFSRDFVLCSVDPFIFTNRTEEKSIDGSFENWLDRATALAFKEFGDRL